MSHVETALSSGTNIGLPLLIGFMIALPTIRPRPTRLDDQLIIVLALGSLISLLSGLHRNEDVIASLFLVAQLLLPPCLFFVGVRLARAERSRLDFALACAVTTPVLVAAALFVALRAGVNFDSLVGYPDRIGPYANSASLRFFPAAVGTSIPLFVRYGRLAGARTRLLVALPALLLLFQAHGRIGLLSLAASASFVGWVSGLRFRIVAVGVLALSVVLGLAWGVAPNETGSVARLATVGQGESDANRFNRAFGSFESGLADPLGASFVVVVSEESTRVAVTGEAENQLGQFLLDGGLASGVPATLILIRMFVLSSRHRRQVPVAAGVVLVLGVLGSAFQSPLTHAYLGPPIWICFGLLANLRQETMSGSRAGTN